MLQRGGSIFNSYKAWFASARYKVVRKGINGRLGHRSPAAGALPGGASEAVGGGADRHLHPFVEIKIPEHCRLVVGSWVHLQLLIEDDAGFRVFQEALFTSRLRGRGRD